MKNKRKHENVEIELHIPDVFVGLREEEVKRRVALGLDNSGAEVRAKSVLHILKDNLFTLFNLLCGVLGVLVLLSGPKQNAMFLGVVFVNLSVGILQQIRAKVAVEKLSLLSKTKVRVLREGLEIEVPVSGVVLHDILVLTGGKQIPADSEVVFGFCEVDESLLTGESDAVYKSPGSKLLSGSYILSGACKAMVQKVGRESYAAKLANETRSIKKINSEILDSFNKIVKFLSVFILVAGAVLFLKQFIILRETAYDSIILTAAAVIGMVPEGLVLLANAVLAVGVMELSFKKVLVQEMYCIETLARVNVLCMDKTGTITDGRVYVSDIVAIDPKIEVGEILKETVQAVGDTNNTALAMQGRFSGEAAWQVESTIPFSPIRKWSGASFIGRGSYLLGAPDILMRDMSGDLAVLKEKLQNYAENGARTLLLVHSEESLLFENSLEAEVPADCIPLAIVVLEDSIREEASEIFQFFQQEGVDIKVISGDSGKLAFSVAKKAGVGGLSSYIDTYNLSDEELKAAVREYSVFGRVLPEQKRLIVRTLKEDGNVVAMTGDGVNDVLALKEADCSISIASGSEAARAISQIVLLDSNLYLMYNVVMKGRKLINNIKRSASLFLVKTIFSCLLSIVFVFLPMAYPFMPIQLSLVSSVCVGIPSFFLALQPNKDRVRGHFLDTVLKNAFPGALCVVFYVVAISVAGVVLSLDREQISTLCTIAAGISAFFVLGKISFPFNWGRFFLLMALVTCFIVAVFIFRNFLLFSNITGVMWGMIGAVGASVAFLNYFFTAIVERFGNKLHF